MDKITRYRLGAKEANSHDYRYHSCLVKCLKKLLGA